MSSNKKILVLFLIVLMMPIAALAQGFTLFSDTEPGDLCPGATGIYTEVVRNDGDDFLSLTISSSGSASSFSTTVPQGTTLYPGQSKTIYTYVTPRSSTTPGTYSLKIAANANGETQEIEHDILVRDCYAFILSALEQEKHICPAESDRFEFTITNNGEYTESYAIAVEGEYASSVILSTDVITVAPGDTDAIFAYATSMGTDLGEYDFTLKATSLNSGSVQTATSTLVVDPCYDFTISTQEDLVNICEHTVETIPITISNSGSTQNKFNLALDGPVWANIDKNSITLNPNTQERVNLILNPDYGVEGSFELEFGATPEKGEVTAYNFFNVNIKKCHGVALNVERSVDKICNSLENTYFVNVRNVGEFTKEYYFDIDGPDWATLDTTSASLAVGEERQLTLTINPPFDTPEATYLINVQATAKDSNKVASSDKIEVTTVTRDECYQALINIEDKDIEVYYDSSATVPVVIENKGTYTTTYDLSLAGTASNFVYLNPSVVTIDSGKSEIVYLYIAPSGQISNGEYSTTISASLGDSGILASEKVDITVTDSGFVPPEESPEEGASFFDRIISFFKNLFAPAETQEDDQVEDVIDDSVVDDLINDTETTDDNETEVEINETPEDNETIEINETEETEVNETEEAPVPSGDIFNLLLARGETKDFTLGEEAHTIELTEATDSNILITITSDPVVVNMGIGDVKKVDLDNDGYYDMKIIFTGFVGDQADITYEEINEEVPEGAGQIETEITGDTTSDIPDDTAEEGTGESFFGSFFSSLGSIFTGAGSSILAYKYHILGIIVLILLIYLFFKTGLNKKVVSFFEEEIEEEETPVLGEEIKLEKKEEPKKKEEKKVEKKTEKKEAKKPAKKTTKKKDVTEDTEDQIEIKGLDEESDKEDFIIEFDDEDEK
jgi:uncharacterized membrane protein